MAEVAVGEVALKVVLRSLLDKLKPIAIAGVKAPYFFHKRCSQLDTTLRSEGMKMLIRDLVVLARRGERDWQSYLGMCCLVEEVHSLVLAARAPGRTKRARLKIAWALGSVNKRMKDAISTHRQNTVQMRTDLEEIKESQVACQSEVPSNALAHPVAQRRANGRIRGTAPARPQLHQKFVDYRQFVDKLKAALQRCCKVAVVGMPGVGKTTAVNSFFVREQGQYKESIRLVVGQNPDIKQLLRSAYIQFNDGMALPSTERELLAHLRHQFSDEKECSVLLFLDDVWETRHWQRLDFATHMTCHPSSRLIVTTRDGLVIREDGQVMDEFEEKMLLPLNDEDSKDLFLRYACDNKTPDADPMLVDALVQNCHGLPNTISLVGSLLRDLPKSEWGGVLKKLRNMPWGSTEQLHLRIRAVVQLSYDALPPAMQQCMRDWAAFPEDHRLQGEYLVGIWSTQMPIASSQSWDQGQVYLDTLVQRSLILHDDQRDAYHVHDTVWHFMTQECERELVTEEQCRSMFKPSCTLEECETAFPEPQSIVPHKKLLQRMGLNFMLPKSQSMIRMSLHGVDLQNSAADHDSPSSAGHSSLIEALVPSGCLRLPSGCLRALPSVRFLNVSGCNLKQVPDALRACTLLRVLDLSHNPLQELPTFLWNLLSLNVLRLSTCTSLTHVHIKDIGSLSQLQMLDLSSCYHLANTYLIDSFCHFSILQSLHLKQCASLAQLPDSFGKLSNLQTLDLSRCTLEQLPDSFGQLSNLQTLDLSRCKTLKQLPDSFGQLSNLQTLDLGGCSMLNQLPDSFGQLSNLQTLDLGGCSMLNQLPDSFGQLSNLQTLDLGGCSMLNQLPDSFGQLSNLQTLDLGCNTLEQLPDSFGQLSNLQTLVLWRCNALRQLPDSFGQLSNLQTLDLSRCNALEQLPDSFGQLSNLQTLDLSWCKTLEQLPDSCGQLSNLQTLDLGGCSMLNQLPDSFGQLSNLQTLDLGGCSMLNQLPDSFGQLSNLQTLDLRWCKTLKQLPDSFGQLSNLQTLDLSRCTLEQLPDSFGQLSNLQTLDLGGCSMLNQLPDSFGQLSNLQTLDLSRCKTLKQLPDSFGQLSNLQTLDLGGCSMLNQLPDSFGQLSNLQTLDLGGCSMLNQLPDSFGQLSNLQTLDLGGCSMLNQLPDSFGQLSNLQTLDLGCNTLEQLPDSFGQLSNLQTLVLWRCNALRQLPDSFGQLSNLQTLSQTGSASLAT